MGVKGRTGTAAVVARERIRRSRGDVAMRRHANVRVNKLCDVVAGAEELQRHVLEGARREQETEDLQLAREARVEAQLVLGNLMAEFGRLSRLLPCPLELQG
jgi:hypothetical protein